MDHAIEPAAVSDRIYARLERIDAKLAQCAAMADAVDTYLRGAAEFASSVDVFAVCVRATLTLFMLGATANVMAFSGNRPWHATVLRLLSVCGIAAATFAVPVDPEKPAAHAILLVAVFLVQCATLPSSGRV